ncbi:hypothetical protein C8R46DRAFT_1103528, partial [Mycena filopes]
MFASEPLSPFNPRLQSSTTSTMAVWLHALLGSPPDELWFLSDFLFAHHLLSEEADRQVWSTQIDVFAALNTLREERPASNQTALHGSPRSEILSLPTSDIFYDKFKQGRAMKRDFLRSIRRMAKDAKAGQHIVLLLFGHGDARLPTLGQVQCGRTHGRATWLTRADVEGAVGLTKGRVSLVVSTACDAPAWKSPLWSLFAAATTDYSVSLPGPTSESDRTWGSSTFWAAILELAAHAHAQLETFEPALDESALQAL